MTTTLFYVIAYVAILGFFGLILCKARAYVTASPIHFRWELYEVPHEGAKAAYGGSFMEETEWWNKPRHVDHWGDMKALLQEVLCLHATFKHNFPLWLRTYPFHFGLYFLMGGAFLVFLAALLTLADAGNSGFTIFLLNIINVISLLGCLGIMGGGIALIVRRLNDEGLAKYSTFEHFFNLGAFVAYAAVGVGAWVVCPSLAREGCTFMVNLLTGNFEPLTSSAFSLHLLIGFVLMLWIPATHMGHILGKYFMYHDIRWGDTPTVFSRDNQKAIGKVLQLKTTWAADHITGGWGAKSWVDVATTNPTQDAK